MEYAGGDSDDILDSICQPQARPPGMVAPKGVAAPKTQRFEFQGNGRPNEDIIAARPSESVKKGQMQCILVGGAHIFRTPALFVHFAEEEYKIAMFDTLAASVRAGRNTRGGEAVVRALVDQLAAGASAGTYTNRSVQRSLGICAKRFGQKVKSEQAIRNGGKRRRDEAPDFAKSLSRTKKRRSDAFPVTVLIFLSFSSPINQIVSCRYTRL
jgi:hypothetical protein